MSEFVVMIFALLVVIALVVGDQYERLEMKDRIEECEARPVDI